MFFQINTNVRRASLYCCVGAQWELPGAVGAQWELPGGVGTQWELRRALARGDQSVGHYDASVHAHVDPRFSPVSAIQAASRTSTGSSRSDRKSTRLNSSHLV